MTRIAGSHGPTTAAAIRHAGLRLIHKHGFEAMTLRQLAAEVGLQSASLYNHISTKQELLHTLILDHMRALLAGLDAALAQAGSLPVDRLRAFISHHLLYHMERKLEVFVANFELRALSTANYRVIVGLRRCYEEQLIALLDEGVREGSIRAPDTKITAYALLAMLTGACTWYKPHGRLSEADVVRLHMDLVLRGCLEPDAHSPACAAGARSRGKQSAAAASRGK